MQLCWLCIKLEAPAYRNIRQDPAQHCPDLGDLTAAIMWAQVSDEAERSVLVKLKTECGYQFTSKLESMFTDIKTSRDTMQEFRARRQAPASSSNGEEEVELSVQVCAHFAYLPPRGILFQTCLPLAIAQIQLYDCRQSVCLRTALCLDRYLSQWGIK